VARRPESGYRKTSRKTRCEIGVLRWDGPRGFVFPLWVFREGAELALILRRTWRLSSECSPFGMARLWAGRGDCQGGYSFSRDVENSLESLFFRPITIPDFVRRAVGGDRGSRTE